MQSRNQLSKIGLLGVILGALTVGCADEGFETATFQQSSQIAGSENSLKPKSFVSSSPRVKPRPDSLLKENKTELTRPTPRPENSETSNRPQPRPAGAGDSTGDLRAADSEGQPDTMPRPLAKPDFAVDPDFKGTPPENDLSRPGVLKPTVYYFAKIDEDNSSCSRDVNLRDVDGKVLIRVCKTTATTCGLQGSCAVVQSGKIQSLNILKRVDGEDRYFEIDQNSCRFGYGVRSSCLDPFYTVAADLSLYKPGDVIYVPSVVGLKLPDGSEHNGFFVVRDRGRGIKGPGRFDFFSGTMSWREGGNPFAKIGLRSVDTNVPYHRVRGETARRVLQERSYPALPQQVVESTSAE